MLCNGGFLMYMHVLVYGPYWGIFSFELFRSPPDPEKCLVEEGVSKLGSCNQGISQYWKCNLQYIRFYGGAVEEAATDRVQWVRWIISKQGRKTHHQDGSHNYKDHVEVGYTDIS